MKLAGIRQTSVQVIKGLSTVLITGAIALELGNLIAPFVGFYLPNSLQPIFWITRFALVAHGIEAAIASIYAPSRNKFSLSYGIYTFFVGTVGLVELFNLEANNQD
ncbi:MAG: hypothetical protein Kow00121_56350 [Elainellaceae cyanobacterium]